MAPPPPPHPGFGVGLVAASFHSLFFFSLCLHFGFSSYIVHLQCTSEGWWSRCFTRPLILSLFVSVFCPAVLLSAQLVLYHVLTRITCIQTCLPFRSLRNISGQTPRTTAFRRHGQTFRWLAESARLFFLFPLR